MNLPGENIKDVKENFNGLIETMKLANLENSPFRIILMAGIGQVLALKSQPQEKIIKAFTILLRRHQKSDFDYMPSVSDLGRYGNLIYATEKHLAKETFDAA